MKRPIDCKALREHKIWNNCILFRQCQSFSPFDLPVVSLCCFQSAAFWDLITLIGLKINTAVLVLVLKVRFITSKAGLSCFKTSTSNCVQTPVFSSCLWSCEAFLSYTLMDAQLQAAILDHINAVINVTRSKESLSLMKLNQHHVTTQLQEERLLKVTKHPGSKRSTAELHTIIQIKTTLGVTSHHIRETRTRC